MLRQCCLGQRVQFRASAPFTNCLTGGIGAPPLHIITWGESDRRPSCHASITLSTSPAFEVSSKRRKGYPSETNVKRGLRFVRGGEVELVEKLGRNDPCPCGSGSRFQNLLPKRRPLSTGRSGMTIGGSEGEGGGLKGPPPSSLLWRVALSYAIKFTLRQRSV